MKLLYRFSGPITNNVIHSQVVGQLAALQRAGAGIDLLAWCGAGHALAHAGAYRRAAAALRGELGAAFRWRPTVDRWPVLDAALKRRELRARLAALERGEGLWLQTRSPDIAELCCELRSRDDRLRFLLEVRGDLRAELEYGGASAARIAAREARLRASLAGADLVTCVSQVLAERLQERYGLDPARTLVLPCTADEQRFRPNPAARAARRAELGLGPDEPLLLYSGSLVKRWDVPERIAAFLAGALALRPRLRVLLLSPDAAAAATLAASLPAGRVQHRSIPHARMQDWLPAGDALLLLRERHPLNEAASPTKAAEALLCGLPLLISAGVGDYSAWVEGAGLGFSLREDRPEEVDWDALLKLDPAAIRHAALSGVARGPHARHLLERLQALS
jgi:hypothetical protein